MRIRSAYINSQILPIIDAILAQSEVKPIILLQGDHGFDPPNRMEILNTYLVPDVVKAQAVSRHQPGQFLPVAVRCIFWR